MIRLFVKANLVSQMPVEVDEKQMHYLLHVMRLKEGDNLLIFNGVDGEWKAKMQLVGKKKVQLVPLTQTQKQMTRNRCCLCPALIKKENMDFVLQKATELGVTEIYPLITERTVVRAFNKERAYAIICEACEQCERNDIPILHEPQYLTSFLKNFPKELTLIHLAERSSKSAQLSHKMIPAFLIGPEGGFTEEENKQIEKIENSCVLHLGTTILRAETASLAILSAWQFRLF